MSQPPPDGDHADRARVDQLRHEVNNPLAIIRGHTHLLQQRLQRPEAWNEQAVVSMLAQLAAIDAAISRAVTAIDTFEQTSRATEDDTPPP